MPKAELELIREDAVVRVVPVDAEPVHLGRDLANTVVLLDEDVSSHHAVVTLSSAGLSVRDLRSTNGTFVNEERVTDTAELGEGDILRLGTEVRLRVRLSEPAAAARPVLHDLTAGTVYALDDDRFTIGSDSTCDLPLPDGPARLATLVVQADGEVWLGTEGESRPLEVGAPFELGGRRFAIAQVPVGRAVTLRGLLSPTYPYRLTATLDGPGGAVATVHHAVTDHSYAVTTEHRATLLYVLARRLQEDLEAGRDELQAGWCDDEDVLIAIWGKAALRKAPSGYSVLVHRLRKELEEAGFDPWFVEKRRGAIRLRLAEVEVV